MGVITNIGAPVVAAVVNKGVTLIMPRVTPGRHQGDTTASWRPDWPTVASPLAPGVTLVSPCFFDRVTPEKANSRSGFFDAVSPMSPLLYEKRKCKKRGKRWGAAAVMVQQSWGKWCFRIKTAFWVTR
jgi:hypothetical protein